MKLVEQIAQFNGKLSLAGMQGVNERKDCGFIPPKIGIRHMASQPASFSMHRHNSLSLSSALRVVSKNESSTFVSMEAAKATSPFTGLVRSLTMHSMASSFQLR
jgi:hypothetical protein